MKHFENKKKKWMNIFNVTFFLLKARVAKKRRQIDCNLTTKLFIFSSRWSSSFDKTPALKNIF